jgi:hypothetical protein
VSVAEVAHFIALLCSTINIPRLPLKLPTAGRAVGLTTFAPARYVTGSLSHSLLV